MAIGGMLLITGAVVWGVKGSHREYVTYNRSWGPEVWGGKGWP